MISKILFTLGVAVVALYGYSLLRRLASGTGSGSGGPQRADEKITADMTKCRICDTYVPREAPAPCERPECPYAAPEGGA